MVQPALHTIIRSLLPLKVRTKQTDNQ